MTLTVLLAGLTGLVFARGAGADATLRETPTTPVRPVLAAQAPGLPVAPATSSTGSAARMQVTLRSTTGTVDGELVSSSGAGLVVRIAAADGTLQDRTIGWDTIRTIDGAAALAGTFLPIGEQLWRGRSRIERGDFVMGERVIEPLYASIMGGTGAGSGAGGTGWPGLGGPTGAVLAEAALRCRLNRGWTTAAIEPWLAWRAAQEEGGRLGGVIVSAGQTPPGQQHWVGGSMSGVGVTDLGTGLCVQLPPIFSNAASARALPAIYALNTWAAAERRAGSTGELAKLYRAAIAGEIAQSSGGFAEPIAIEMMKSADPGVRLCAEIVVARVGTSAQRAEARGALKQRLAIGKLRTADSEVAPAQTMSSWQEAWVRAAIGRSLLLETDLRSRREALVSLLHVPARFGEQVPWLAAICLREAIEALKQMGDSEGAARLTADLNSRLGDFATDESAPAATPEGGENSAPR